MPEREIRQRVPDPPSALKRLAWYGPGLLWMISSVGSGSVLFTPRVGSRYEYDLLWAAVFVIFLMWIMIREVGRYTVVTGKTILDGYRELPGPGGWAIWLIFLPQVIAAIVTIAGIGALVGSALMIALPGSQPMYTTAIILISAALVLSGRYKGVERVASGMSIALVLIAVVTAARVFPEPSAFMQGLIPGIPDDFDLYFVLPWLGFILAGAAGIMWFSYWVAARGYGGNPAAESGTQAFEAGEHSERREEKLRDWLRLMSTTAALGVVGGGLVIMAFLVLGTELLAPEGVVPEGIDVAEDLTLLLSEVWGEFGFWLLIVGIVIALWGTILANQDGWPRMFADATHLLLGANYKHDDRHDDTGAHTSWWKQFLEDKEKLKNAYVISTVTILPLLVFFLVRDPVDILSVAGIVAAVHTPVVVLLTLYLNKRNLPQAFQPSTLSIILMLVAGGFFAVFAILHLFDLIVS